MEGIQLLTEEEQIELNLQQEALRKTRIEQDEELEKVVDEMNWHVALTELTKKNTKVYSLYWLV